MRVVGATLGEHVWAPSVAPSTRSLRRDQLLKHHQSESLRQSENPDNEVGDLPDK
jgi:hypothetical protein